MPLSRRHFLHTLGAAAALPVARLGLAAPASGKADGERLVFVLLRGGLDGLAAVPAPGDPDYAGQRGSLANQGGEPLALDGFFALHPRLIGLHGLWQAKQLAVVHAVATPYRERSHFDAQQVLESGGMQPHVLTTGWLGRALQASGRQGLALATIPPLALRGAGAVETWSPSRAPEPDPALLERLGRMYEQDAQLGPALSRAMEQRGDGGMAGDAAARGDFLQLSTRAGEFLAAERGPRVAMLEMTGWDSHAGQANPKGALLRALGQLDDGLMALQAALGPAWARTTVVVVSEFGRTVRENGTRGTDHGTAGAAFVLGGRVAGGKVLGDWPGLASASLHQDRDLRATIDLRALLAALAGPALGLGRRQLAETVFPGSQGLKPVEGLLA
ncbi:DUF1501 domain-containing protein [Azoarcus sp. TTM-91]|uniref:DUF1501 domain-containing protein n=1 Tax=Azoarcus sp. TTM-91 TaxID=2691581 RepID=UPI00145E9C96|nr:DUF1501 domain-containing protein [Azoarcus sp. TTM-91]NMG36478.1 DUF1501 domain-containing protein [Azoarcus sp. TTM-91]